MYTHPNPCPITSLAPPKPRVSDYRSLPTAVRLLCGCSLQYECQQFPFPTRLALYSSYAFILEPLLWCLYLIVYRAKLNLLCEEVHVSLLVIRLLWLFSWVVGNIRLMKSAGRWNIVWTFNFSTFFSPWLWSFTGHFMHTIGRVRLGVCVWVQVNSSSTSDRQLGLWSLEGPNNCLVDIEEQDRCAPCRIGFWHVRLIWKKGGAYLNWFDFLWEVYLVCILPLTCQELDIFFEVLSQWKSGPGSLCCQLHTRVWMAFLELCNGYILEKPLSFFSKFM